MITINKGLIIFLLLIFFTIVGSVSASYSNTPNNFQNYEELANYETNDYHNNHININSTKTKKSEYTLTSKYNNIESSNHSNLTSPNNINHISNSDNEAQHIFIKEYDYYNSNCSLIQNIITESPKGSTVEFTGSLYKDLSLNINKPLNIISKVGTTITMTSNTPVFNINGGSGTTISGFTINTEGSFINAKDVSNINIKNNKISKSNTGIIFYNVFNSKIQNNEFLGFNTAIDIRKSGAITISQNNINANKAKSIGINLEDDTSSEGINILDNQIIGPGKYIDSIAINVGKNVYNVLIKGNIIKNWYTGIYFEKSINNFNITNNTITQNMDGVLLESGKLNGFSFTKNVVTDNNGCGVLLSEFVEGYTNNPLVENNYFTKNGMDMKSVGDTNFDIGNNFAKNLCHKLRMKPGFYVKFLKNGNKIIATVTGSGGKEVKDLPNFQGTLNIDGKNYNLQFKNGVAYLDLSGTGSGSGDGLSNSQFGVGADSRSINDWGYSVNSMSDNELENYLKEYFGYSNTEDTNNQEDKKEKQSNSTSNQGSGSRISGSSSGESYVSSSTTSASSSSSPGSSVGSGSSSSSSSSSASASATDSTTSSSPESPGSEGSSSNTPNQSNKVVAKEILVDDEKYKVAGVVGLITLILLVIGMYYREDVFEMMGDN